MIRQFHEFFQSNFGAFSKFGPTVRRPAQLLSAGW
jgi:hypothetical protein